MLPSGAVSRFDPPGENSPLHAPSSTCIETREKKKTDVYMCVCVDIYFARLGSVNYILHTRPPKKTHKFVTLLFRIIIIT